MSCLKARPTKLSDSALAAVAAAIVFTAFHAAGATGQAPALLASTILLNGIFGVGLGVLYARYGLESLVLCAAIGHLLAVSLASFRR